MDEAANLLTRRSALRGGALGVAAFVLLDGAATASARTSRALVRSRLLKRGWRRARFAPHVGTKVKLRPQGGPATRAVLAGVEDLSAGLAGAQDAYLLRFRGPGSLVLQQGTVGVRHPRFGVVELFVTPGTRTERTQEYLAIVNRRVPASARR